MEDIVVFGVIVGAASVAMIPVSIVALVVTRRIEAADRAARADTRAVLSAIPRGVETGPTVTVTVDYRKEGVA